MRITNWLNNIDNMDNKEFEKLVEKAKNKYNLKPSELFLYRKGMEDMLNYITNK